MTRTDTRNWGVGNSYKGKKEGVGGSEKKDTEIYLKIEDKEKYIEDIDLVVYTCLYEGDGSKKFALKYPKMKHRPFLILDCKEIGRAMDAIYSAYECTMSV